MAVRTEKPHNLSWFVAISVVIHALLLLLAPLSPGMWGLGERGRGQTPVRVLVISPSRPSSPAAQARNPAPKAAAPPARGPRVDDVPTPTPQVRPAPEPVSPAEQPAPVRPVAPTPTPTSPPAPTPAVEPLTSAGGEIPAAPAVKPPQATPAVAPPPAPAPVKEADEAQSAPASSAPAPLPTGDALLTGMGRAGYPKEATNAAFTRPVRVPLLLVVSPEGNVQLVCPRPAPDLENIDAYTAERLRRFALQFGRTARFGPQPAAYAVQAAVVFDPQGGGNQGAVRFEPAPEAISFDPPDRCA
ncbi:MAG TPA: hypothetical protein VF234_03750 [Limnochordia bacterium]